MVTGGNAGLLGRRYNWGPIFHANDLRTEESWRKYVMRHACLRNMARQDNLHRF